jgi:DNA-binding NarL/FixJ family response regulator
MAKIVLIGLEHAEAGQICRALGTDDHRIEHHTQHVDPQDFADADLVFAGGDPAQYLSLLSRVRDASPNLPVVVVTRIPDTNHWLDALEAGARDYCSLPIVTPHLHWIVESALPRTLSAAA